MFSYGKRRNGLHGRMQKLDMIKETEKPDLSTPKWHQDWTPDELGLLRQS